MEAIKDLFNIDRYLTPKGKVLDERATLIKFFADAVERPPHVVGIRLAHFNLSLLYALKSGYQDRLTRNGREAAHKWFWWSTRTHAVHDERTA